MYSRRRFARLLGIGLTLLGPLTASAQEAARGTWSGTLEVGGGLRIVFHVEQGQEGLTATMDSPDQGATEIPVSDVSVRVLDGLNHLFQPTETGLPNEYARIETTMAPQALEAVSGWIRERTP